MFPSKPKLMVFVHTWKPHSAGRDASHSVVPSVLALLKTRISHLLEGSVLAKRGIRVSRSDSNRLNVGMAIVSNGSPPSGE